MSIITQTLAIICPEVTVTGDSSEFTEECYNALAIDPENYRPSWHMVEISAAVEGFLSSTANVNERITNGSMWDRFTGSEREFFRQSENILLPRNEALSYPETYPPYDKNCADFKEAILMHGYVDLTRQDLLIGIAYLCQTLADHGLITDAGVRYAQLIVNGTQAEKYKGVV